MKTLELSNASKPLADYTAELDSESIVITSNDKPVAALVSLKGIDRESVALSLSADFAKIIRRARSEAKRGKVFSLGQIKEELRDAMTPKARPPRTSSARKKRSPRRG